MYVYGWGFFLRFFKYILEILSEEILNEEEK